MINDGKCIVKEQRLYHLVRMTDFYIKLNLYFPLYDLNITKNLEQHINLITF